MTQNDADVAPPSSQRRRRSGVSLRLLFILLLALAATGCGAQASSTNVELAQLPTIETTEPAPAAPLEDPTEVPSEPAPPTPLESSPTPTPAPTPTPHPVTVADTDLPSAPIGFESLFDTAPSGPQPISIEIESINVRDADIIPVGVNQEDLSFEVPPADQVGWYEFGSTPGEAGSAVLAAHIAYNGVDGVFRYLENVEVGSIVSIGFDDGTSRRYRIEEVTEYIKQELPDSLFARDGKEQLALITCGGTFNYQLESYESNTVAIAVPL
jgi:LPXTG-site transpeptidase (sortase) family protein